MMTAMSFDPIAIYYTIILLSLPVLLILYTAFTEYWYWKGWKDGKRLAENAHKSSNVVRFGK